MPTPAQSALNISEAVQQRLSNGAHPNTQVLDLAVAVQLLAQAALAATPSTTDIKELANQNTSTTKPAITRNR